MSSALKKPEAAGNAPDCEEVRHPHLRMPERAPQRRPRSKTKTVAEEMSASMIPEQVSRIIRNQISTTLGQLKTKLRMFALGNGRESKIRNIGPNRKWE